MIRKLEDSRKVLGYWLIKVNFQRVFLARFLVGIQGFFELFSPSHPNGPASSAGLKKMGTKLSITMVMDCLAAMIAQLRQTLIYNEANYGSVIFF